MSDDNDSFFQEVDESLRADQLSVWLKRWGPWAGGLLLVVLVGVVGWDQWKNHQAGDAAKTSEAFAAAQDQFHGNHLPEAATAFETLSKTGPQSYRIMAMMERAAVLQQQGDLQAAIAEYDRAAGATNDALLKDSARIRAAYLVADTQDFAAVRRRVDPIIAEHNQFSYLARELLAVEAWEAGEYQLARDTLNGINLAFDAPQSVRERAQRELAAIGSGGGPSQPAAPAHQPNTAPSPGEPK